MNEATAELADAPANVKIPILWEIPLPRGQVALVSPEDYAWAQSIEWGIIETSSGSFYAKINEYVNRKVLCTYMHREIMKRMGHDMTGKRVDHRNQNSLDNSRSNLRLCTQSGNAANARKRNIRNGTSRFKGVQFVKKSKINPWCAMITKDYKPTYLGVFPTEEAAAGRYDEAARLLHGEFAVLNFP